MNDHGLYECECFTGYTGDGFECNDIDECILGLHNCPLQSHCVNNDGSYICKCNAGYKKAPGVDDVCEEGSCVGSCIDLDECFSRAHTCSELHICNNSIGSYTCDCKTGYSGDGDKCEDVDECRGDIKGDTAHCNANAECINTIGSYRCKCKNGYSGDGTTCSNSNECVDGHHNCHEDADCFDRDGHFVCECREGYTGDGVTCTDADSCAENADNCHARATCIDTIGSYKCVCDEGFSGTGDEANGFIQDVSGCWNIDECATGLHHCLEHQECADNIGSYGCYCEDGWIYVGGECIDRDECTPGGHLCDIHAVCINNIGSYQCQCNIGFSNDPNGGVLNMTHINNS